MISESNCYLIKYHSTACQHWLEAKKEIIWQPFFWLGKPCCCCFLCIFSSERQAKSCHLSVKSDSQTLSHKVSMVQEALKHLKTPAVHPVKSHKEDNIWQEWVPNTMSNYILTTDTHTQKNPGSNNLKQMSLPVPSRFQKSLRPHYYIPYYSILRLKQKKSFPSFFCSYLIFKLWMK